MIARKLILAAILLMPAACGEEAGVVFEEEIAHPGGLIVARPAGFIATSLGEGIALIEEGEVRTPRGIQVEVVAAAPVLVETSERSVAGGSVRYAIKETGGGSGGTEYRLIAVREIGGRIVVLSATEQRELGTPDFAVAWAVLERVRIE